MNNERLKTLKVERGPQHVINESTTTQTKFLKETANFQMGDAVTRDQVGWEYH
jgi:hypothetical protein